MVESLYEVVFKSNLSWSFEIRNRYTMKHTVTPNFLPSLKRLLETKQQKLQKVFTQSCAGFWLSQMPVSEPIPIIIPILSIRSMHPYMLLEKLLSVMLPFKIIGNVILFVFWQTKSFYLLFVDFKYNSWWIYLFVNSFWTFPAHFNNTVIILITDNFGHYNHDNTFSDRYTSTLLKELSFSVLLFKQYNHLKINL